MRNDLGRLGFCCLFYSENKKEIEPYQFKTTTVSSFIKLNQKEKEEKLESLILNNFKSLNNLLQYVNLLPKNLKMLRFSSGLLPLFTHESTKFFYQKIKIKKLITEEFEKIGTFVRLHDIRIGFHPDQFCLLASKNEQALINGIKEFNYHLEMIEMMNFSGWHDHGAFINIHLGSKEITPQELLNNLKKLSKNAINFLTIENDEFSHGVDSLKYLSEKVALVLDVHHHWIKTGSYINIDDHFIQIFKNSWKNVRPLMHYSVSPQEVISSVISKETLPDFKHLKENHLKVKDLRKHSDDYWNDKVNDYIKQFLPYFDIECEAKFKNLASLKLYNYLFLGKTSCMTGSI